MNTTIYHINNYKSINRNSNSGAFLRGRPPFKELQGQALFAAGRRRLLGALQPAQGERAVMREKTFVLRGKVQKVRARNEVFSRIFRAFFLISCLVIRGCSAGVREKFRSHLLQQQSSYA